MAFSIFEACIHKLPVHLTSSLQTFLNLAKFAPDKMGKSAVMQGESLQTFVG
jgi:hypothetical protein